MITDGWHPGIVLLDQGSMVSHVAMRPHESFLRALADGNHIGVFNLHNYTQRRRAHLRGTEGGQVNTIFNTVAIERNGIQDTPISCFWHLVTQKIPLGDGLILGALVLRSCHPEEIFRHGRTIIFIAEDVEARAVSVAAALALWFVRRIPYDVLEVEE